MSKKIDVLNIKFNALSMSSLLSDLKTGILFTANVDHLVKLQKDKEFYAAYQQADYVVCDSRIVKRASKILHNPIQELIPGSDFFPAFYKFHKNNPNVKVFLLGAAEGVAIGAMDKINKQVGRKLVVGAHSPSYGFENKPNECRDIVNIINATEANVLVVGVGAPKQEKWIVTHKDLFNKIDIFLALGATIDFEAGNVKRAPLVFQKMGFEWFYRLLQEPRRLWKRYLLEGLPFFSYILLQRLNLYKDPFLDLDSPLTGD